MAKFNVILRDVTGSQTILVWTVTNAQDRRGNSDVKLLYPYLSALVSKYYRVIHWDSFLCFLSLNRLKNVYFLMCRICFKELINYS